MFYPPSKIVNGSGVICGDGFYPSNDSCITCDPGYVSIDNNTSCTKCPDGSLITDNLCGLCPVNSISNDNKSECTECGETKIVYNNKCVVGGRYIQLCTLGESTRSIQVKSIETYSIEDNFNNNVSLINTSTTASLDLMQLVLIIML